MLVLTLYLVPSFKSSNEMVSAKEKPQSVGSAPRTLTTVFHVVFEPKSREALISWIHLSARVPFDRSWVLRVICSRTCFR